MTDTAPGVDATGTAPGPARASTSPAPRRPSEETETGRATRLPRDQRRAQLVAAAQEVFAGSGYHATAMDEIAEHAGVSKPVLYQHFPGKLELYIALLEAHVDELVRHVQTALDSTTDNKARVTAAVGAFFDFVNSNPGAYRMVFEYELRGEPQVLRVVERATTDTVEAITATITADAGLDAGPARVLAAGLVGLSQVSARFWLEHHSTINRDDAVSLIATLAWRGIGHGYPLQQ